MKSSANVWIGLNLALAALIGWLLLASTPSVTIQTPVVEPHPLDLSANSHLMSGLGEFTQYRSLFRPAATDTQSPAPVVVPELKGQERALRLVGIVGQGNYRIAFIEVSGETESQRVIPGEAIEGWRITAIGLREVTLKKGTVAQMLLLDPLVKP